LPTLNPEARFVDGAVVGVGSFKPGKQKKNPGNFIRHDFLFPFNQAMNILWRARVLQYSC
jgi:hypothetical protein